MSEPPANNNLSEEDTISQNEGMMCDGEERPDTDAEFDMPGATELEIISVIEERKTSSSEYLTRNTAERILTDEANIGEVNDEFENIISTLEKLLIDIAVLSRSNVTADLSSNWDDLERISSSAISICEQSFNESTTSSSDPEHKLGVQFGRILSTLTGRVAENPRAARFYAGLSREYTRYADRVESYPTRSELIDNTENSVYPEDILLDRLEDSLDDATKERIEKYDYKPVDGFIVRASLTPADSMRIRSAEKIETYDSKELHDNIIDLLENRCGCWFGMCTNIHLKINEELESIDNASAPGIDAKVALRELWNTTNNKNGSGPTSSEIAAKCKNSGSDRQVTQIFNSLSYETKASNSQADKQLSHDKPIVKYDDNWKLTPYGRLICLYMVSWEESDSRIHRCALDKVTGSTHNSFLQGHREIVRQGLMDFYDVTITKYS